MNITTVQGVGESLRGRPPSPTTYRIDLPAASAEWLHKVLQNQFIIYANPEEQAIRNDLFHALNLALPEEGYRTCLP